MMLLPLGSTQQVATTPRRITREDPDGIYVRVHYPSRVYRKTGNEFVAIIGLRDRVDLGRGTTGSAYLWAEDQNL